MERKKEKKKKAKRGGTFEEDEGGQMCVSGRFIFFFFFLSRDELIQMTHRFSFKCPQTFFFLSLPFCFFFFFLFFFLPSELYTSHFIFFLSVCVCAGFSRRVSYSNCAALSDCVMSSSLSASSSSSFFFPLAVWLLMTIRRGGERVELVFNRFPLSLSLSG